MKFHFSQFKNHNPIIIIEGKEKMKNIFKKFPSRIKKLMKKNKIIFLLNTNKRFFHQNMKNGESTDPFSLMFSENEK
jgi:nucleoside-triphosphatase THEP1